MITEELNLKDEKHLLSNTINSILGISYKNIKNIEKLGGMTNKNYKITVDNNEFVVRIPGEATKKLINRINEKNNCLIAYKLGIDSECIYFDESTGIKISRYIENGETLNISTAQQSLNLKLIGQVLKKLHNSTKKFNSTFDAFYTTELYEKALLKSNGNLFEDYEEVKRIFPELKNKLYEEKIEYVPCHLDPLPENFIKNGGDKIYLIDWEYSGNYDPLWDVAAVSLECDLSVMQEEIFLEEYLGSTPNNYEKIRIHIHKIMQDMFWAMWSANKAANGECEFYEYSLKRYNRGKNNINMYIDMENI